MIRLFVGIALSALLLGSSLNAQDSRPKDSFPRTLEKETPASLGPFSFPLAKGWIQEAPSNRMRLVQAKLPNSKKKIAPAELAVFYFGEGQGGTVQANLARWKSQFQKPEGRSDADFSQEYKVTVSGLSVTTLSVHGKYAPAAMPGRPAQKPIDDARMFAIIVETKQGPYFIKITGPTSTMDQHKAGLAAIVRGIKKTDKK